MEGTHAEHDVLLLSSALSADALFVLAVDGVAAVSTLFSYDVRFQSKHGPLDDDTLQAMLDGHAALAFGPLGRSPIFGVLRSVSAVPSATAHTWEYQAVLAPRAWVCGLAHRSRVFQDLAAHEVALRVLKDHGMREGEHVELRLRQRHPKREYVVQYQETDLDFLSRLLEHEGIFYFFEHTAGGDVMVLGDSNDAFRPLAPSDQVAYRPTGGRADQPEAVQAIGRTLRKVSQEVCLRDYNYRTPSTAVVGRAPVHASGHGVWAEYGEHVKNSDDATRVARMVAEEIGSQRLRYEGRATLTGALPGATFTLLDHEDSAYGEPLVVLSTAARARQSAQRGASPDDNEAWNVRFTALRAADPYRPPRSTPWPSIAGLMYGKIDGTTPGTLAPLDDQGRYRVVLPLDSAAKTGGAASRWIRMAQPFAGGAYGMHFPLHIGAEVVIAHVEGDPDRPVIVGAVPNPETSSPVTSHNASQSVVRTRAGIHIEFEDDA